MTKEAARKLLQNNAENLIDADLRRKYDLDLVTNGSNVYEVTKRSAPDKNGNTKIVEKKLMARVYALSTFYNDKGSLFDKDFLNDLNMRYNIACDEFEREKGEKNTFNVLYSFVNQLETKIRSTVKRTKIFLMGNTLEEASDILCAFNFIPEDWGTFKLCKHKKLLCKLLKEMDDPDPKISANARKIYGDLTLKDRNYFGKRAVVQNIEPSEEYLNRRAGTIASILMPTASTFTNKIDTDTTLINKSKLISPKYIIKFTKDKGNWYTVWNSNIVTKYKGEKKPVVAMRPYLDEVFNIEAQKNMILLFDTRSLQFRNLITFKQFQSDMEELKPRK